MLIPIHLPIAGALFVDNARHHRRSRRRRYLDCDRGRGRISLARCRLNEALTVARQVNDEATEGKVLAGLQLLAENTEKREVAFA